MPSLIVSFRRGDVADAEEELLVADEEVEEIATDGLRRCQLSEDIDIVAIGIGGEDLRQHGHLNVAGYLELTLDGCLSERSA